MMEELVSRTEYILREAMARFSNPAVLWSTGKDSTCMLALIRKAFFGQVPLPVIHLDTGRKFPEIYRFRDRLAREWGLELIIGKNREAMRQGVSPEDGRFACCTALKTEALKQVLRRRGFDALIMSIRRDEHAMRSMERYFSPRDRAFQWHIVERKRGGMVPFDSCQEPELWNLYQTDFGEDCSHVRVHPILHWTELDVWRYTRQENLPVNPLYFSRDGKRYRSLGCQCCTSPVESDASDIDAIIRELESGSMPERAGRAQDKEHEHNMRRLRSLGYM